MGYMIGAQGPWQWPIRGTHGFNLRPIPYTFSSAFIPQTSPSPKIGWKPLKQGPTMGESSFQSVTITSTMLIAISCIFLYSNFAVSSNVTVTITLTMTIIVILEPYNPPERSSHRAGVEAPAQRAHNRHSLPR